MKRFITFIFFAFLLVQIQAKPLSKTTSFNSAVKNAKFIVVAEVVGHQFEDMKEGESITVDIYSLWHKYRILRVYKNLLKDKKIAPGKILKIQNKSNSCIRFRTTVKRIGKKLYFVHDYGRTSKKEVQPIGRYQKFNKKKVILFLDYLLIYSSKKRIFYHHGWFISPTMWKKGLEKKLR